MSCLRIGGTGMIMLPFVAPWKIKKEWITDLPLYKAAPVKHKIIICEPLLSAINFKGELGIWVEQIVVGGESGKEARICNYDWVLDIRRQCIENNISFWFKQTGYRLLKGEREYKIARQFQHTQARKAGINYSRGSNSNNYSD